MKPKYSILQYFGSINPLRLFMMKFVKILQITCNISIIWLHLTCHMTRLIGVGPVVGKPCVNPMKNVVIDVLTVLLTDHAILPTMVPMLGGGQK